MRIKSTDPKRLWTDYLVTSSESGKTYRVALRGIGLGESFCSCPDFRKNTLGTCKHILQTLTKVRRRFPATSLQRKHRVLGSEGCGIGWSGKCWGTAASEPFRVSASSRSRRRAPAGRYLHRNDPGELRCWHKSDTSSRAGRAYHEPHALSPSTGGGLRTATEGACCRRSGL